MGKLLEIIEKYSCLETDDSEKNDIIRLEDLFTILTKLKIELFAVIVQGDYEEVAYPKLEAIIKTWFGEI